DLLSPSEISVVQRALDEESISPEEKRQIENWLNTSKPPSNETIKEWKSLIDNSNVKLVESDPYPLTELSQKLAGVSGDVEEINLQLKSIEVNLGIQPNHYHHLFEIEVDQKKTANFYNADAIDDLLKGENKVHINKFRCILSEPIFTWDIHRIKDEYRL